MATTTTRKSIKAPRKKAPAAPRRIKTGLPAVPMHAFEACKRYFHEDIDKKVVADIVKTWIKKTYSKDKAKAILACPEYHFHMHSPHAAAIHWMGSGLEFTEDKHKRYPEAVREYYDALIPTGTSILAREAAQAAKTVGDVPGSPLVAERLSPAQLLMKKIQSTIMVDIDFLEDE